MGWAILEVVDSNGAEVEHGEHKLWSPIKGEWDAGVDGASELVSFWFELLERRGLLDSVSASKVSTDSQAMLVVYLGMGVDWQEPASRRIAEVMREFCGSQPVKAGWARVAGSETLGVF